MKTFHVMPYRQLFALLTIGFGSVCIAHAETASSSANQQIGSTSSGVQTEVTTDENLLDQIPRWVDATPTIFPEQSNEPIVPPTEQTEDQNRRRAAQPAEPAARLRLPQALPVRDRALQH